MKTTITNNTQTLTNTFIAICLLMVTTTSAQQLVINQRSSLVMNGNVHLVINGAGLKNNGTFTAGYGTVNFSGYADTTVTNLSGTTSTTFNNLTISKSTNGVALKSAADVMNTLTVTGGILYTDSNLTLKSTNKLTARVAPVAVGANIIGKAKVERFVPAKRAWRLMTAPVTDATSIYNSWQNAGVYTVGKGTFVTGPNAAAANGMDVSPQNTTSMKKWNAATQSFSNVTNTYVSISAGNTGSADNTGYFIFVRGDRNNNNFSTSSSNATTVTSIGRLQVGAQTFTTSAAAGGFTLIGNPYASPVDFNNITKTNVLNRFYVWDPSLNSLGGYVMLDDLAGTGSFIKSVLASTMTKDIQSSQAVFVQTILPGAASVTFNESSKSTINNTAAFRPASPVNNPSSLLRTNLYLSNTDSLILADGIFAEFNAAFSDSVLIEDAPKFTNVNENIALVRNNNTLAAERRPLVENTDTLFIKTWKTTARNYQFEFIPTNMDAVEIYLQDSYLNSNMPINLVGSTRVNFTINPDPASAATNRFRIIFKKAVVLPVTISSVKAFQQNNNIAVEWKVENEINMNKYELEKSTSGTEFTKAYTVNVTGTNNIYNTYKWLDVNAAQGNNFYRIKSIDRNGTVKYSAIVKVAINGNKNCSMRIYPNPVQNNIINLQLANQPKGTYQMRLTNSIGQVLYITSLQSNSTNTTLSIKIPGKLASGVYNLEVNTAENIRSTQAVIVE